MGNNVKTRTIVIVAVILACVFGVIGFPKSLADLKKNWDQNIRLGLDLKGGRLRSRQMARPDRQVRDDHLADPQQRLESSEGDRRHP